MRMIIVYDYATYRRSVIGNPKEGGTNIWSTVLM